MGNFEKLSVLVIVVIIVMILVVALYQLTDNPDGGTATAVAEKEPATLASQPNDGSAMGPSVFVPPPRPVDPRATPPAPPVSARPVGPVNPIDPSVLTPQNGTTNPPGTGETPPVAEPPKPAEPKIHVVQPGETIAKIAKLYYPNQVAKGTEAILRANATVDPARMRVGTKLVIPDLGTDAAAVAPGAQPASAKSGSAPKPATSLKPGGTYVTVRGDTLAAISRRAYGDASRWQDIWLANFEALGDDPEKPAPGTRLTLPR